MGTSLYHDLVQGHSEPDYYLLVSIVVALVVLVVADSCQLRHDGANTMGSRSYGCKHCRNRCRIRFGCCDEVFDCWECHYKQRENGHHNWNHRRNGPVKVICVRCDREQDMKQVCENKGCGARMVDYYCTNCKKFYDAYTVHERPLFCTGCGENMFVSDEEYSACSASSLNPTTISSEYYSPRIASIIEEKKNNPEMDKVESEINASKTTWTKFRTSAKYESVVEELEVFKSLRIRWPYFFINKTVTVGAKIAEGGEAEIFEVSGDSNMVVKLFKEGWRLVDLEKLIPRVILNFGWDYVVYDGIDHWGGMRCNVVNSGIFVDGRFAILMSRMWGDLRTVIDERMIYNNMQAPPFSENVSAMCMHQIALGMSYLHRINILHRDLKTSNVLVQGVGKKLMIDKKLPLHGEFKCYIADFEISGGVVGTGFYRAPEVLHALKNRSSIALAPELFSKATDVYSYGMTCYEILTGRIPLEELRPNNFDEVIGGYRPKLPSRVPRWMKDLLTKCWHMDPCKRPTFDEIVRLLKEGIGPPISKSLVMSLYSRAKGKVPGF